MLTAIKKRFIVRRFITVARFYFLFNSMTCLLDYKSVTVYVLWLLCMVEM